MKKTVLFIEKGGGGLQNWSEPHQYHSVAFCPEAEGHSRVLKSSRGNKNGGQHVLMFLFRFFGSNRVHACMRQVALELHSRASVNISGQTRQL